MKHDLKLPKLQRPLPRRLDREASKARFRALSIAHRRKIFRRSKGDKP